MVAADARTAVVFALSPANDDDAPHGGALLEELGPMPEGLPMLMNRVYEGNGTIIMRFTRNATRSNGCSAGSKASTASSHALKNSISSCSASSRPHSLSKPCE
jgi:hypothetical protein